MKMIDLNQFRMVFRNRMDCFMPAIKQFWNELDKLDINQTGAFKLDYFPEGLLYRFTMYSKRSTIKGVQAFPFIDVGKIGIFGYTKIPSLVQELLGEEDFFIDDYICLSRSGLPSLGGFGTVVIVVPKDIYYKGNQIGHWVYVSNEEVVEFLQEKKCWSLIRKFENLAGKAVST